VNVRCGLHTSRLTARSIVVGLAPGLVSAACFALPANDACPGNCLCHATPETCPIGCSPHYDILADGGGTGQFSCLNSAPGALDAQVAEAGNTGVPPVCALRNGAIPDASVPQGDLPTGACSGGESCSALVQAPDCPGLVVGWTCSCVDEAWSCDITSAGTTVCAVDAAALDATAAAPGTVGTGVSSAP
jgi:hypothetical protein